MLLNCGAGRLLRVPWPAGRSNQSILKEINPEYSLKRLTLKLKLQYFGHLMPTHWQRPWCWKRLRARSGGDRGWDGWMASPTQWTWVWPNSWRRTGNPSILQFMGLQSQTRLSNWATRDLWVCFQYCHWLFLDMVWTEPGTSASWNV